MLVLASPPPPIRQWQFRFTISSSLLRTPSVSNRTHRLLTSLEKTRDDPSSTSRLIRRFVKCSSRSLLLSTLRHLLLSNSHRDFALPMYSSLLETTWYQWSSKNVALLAAILEKHGDSTTAKTLIADSLRLLGDGGSPEFYCELIDAYSRRGLQFQVDELSEQLRSLGPLSSSSYRSIIKALARMDNPDKARSVTEEMISSGFRPTAHLFRSILISFGRTGQFSEMESTVEWMEKSGFPCEPVAANMILSSLGTHRRHSDIIKWIRIFRNSQIPFSIRIFSSVANSLPALSEILNSNSPPLTIRELYAALESESESTVLVLKELFGTRREVFAESVDWSATEWKLDLHGYHLCAAYLVLLQWVEEVRERINSDSEVVVCPLEVSIVCGRGKHSKEKGESPIKRLVSNLMFRLESPLRLDRLNNGRFIAKGKRVKEWVSRIYLGGVNDL